MEETNLNSQCRSDSIMKARCQSFLRQTYGLDPGKRHRVYSLLLRFGAGKIDDSLLISVLNQLFHDHDHLLQCFQSIVPSPTSCNQEGSTDDNHIVEKVSLKRKDFATPDDDKQNPPKRPKFSRDLSQQILRATEYCNKVRDRFRNDDGAYMAFLEAISTCYDKNGDDDHKTAACKVEKKLKSVFGDNTDLQIELLEFKADFYMADEEERKAWEARKRGIRSYKTSYRRIKEHPCIEMLNKIDDDIFECDMVFHSLQNTRKGLKKFVQKIKEEGGRSLIKLEDYLSAIYLRRIEYLYYVTGDGEGWGQEVIKQLRENSIKAGEIVLERLRQKKKEIKEMRREANVRIWAPARKNCYEKLNKQCSRRSSPNSPLQVGRE